MLVKAISALAGGGTPVKSGTFERTTSNTVTVNCGFRPRKIFTIKGSASSSSVANGEVQDMYDEDWSDTYVINNYRNNNNYQMSKISPSTLFTLTDTGFIFAAASASTWAGTYYYTAIGE